jgi:hypothetical protein
MEPLPDPADHTDDTAHTDVLSSDPPQRGRRSRRGVVGALLTVALLAAGATGVALAADNGTATPTPGSSGSPSAGPEGGRQGPLGDHDGDRRGGPGRPGFGGPGMLGLMGAVHGEVVVPKQGGGYETLLMQRGTVTSVSSSAISVKSADGFTATYDVTGSTQVNAGSAGITSIDKNANVVVIARKTASGGTALRVLDLSQLGQFHRDFDGDGRHGPDGRGPGSPGGTATPTPSGSTGGASFGV